MTKFKVDVDFPKLELQINKDNLQSEIGKAVAHAVRSRLGAGQGAAGTMPTDLRETGELIASVKYRPSRKKSPKQVDPGVIFATGTRADGKSNAMILSVNLARNTDLKASKPLGEDARLRNIAKTAASKAIADQIQRKELKLSPKD